MTWCEEQFSAFNERIRLDATRLARIRGAIDHFSTFCSSDEHLKAAGDGAPFLQGSTATKTVITPLSGDEFDVDVVYPFNLDALHGDKSPPAIVNWFLGRLKNDAFYRENLIPKDRCARIEYVGDFHLDIIPATRALPDHQPYAVPAKDLGDWVANDPVGFVNWIEELDHKSNGADHNGDGRFVRSVRYIKRWRDDFFQGETAPASILLSTFLGKHEPNGNYSPALENPLFPTYATEAAYTYDMLRLTHSCIQMSSGSAYRHQTLDSDLGRNWREQYEKMFLDRLQTCIDQLRLAIFAENDGQALEHYRQAFGDTFPAA